MRSRKSIQQSLSRGESAQSFADKTVGGVRLCSRAVHSNHHVVKEKI